MCVSGSRNRIMVASTVTAASANVFVQYIGGCILHCFGGGGGGGAGIAQWLERRTRD